MQDILVSLQELDRLYHADALRAYEQTWQTVEQQVRLAFPGFTIAYAEIFTAESERRAQEGMHHVLFPKPRETSC
jgi:hypothetical protein